MAPRRAPLPGVSSMDGEVTYTRAQAIELGLTHYTSEKPCTDCGGRLRYLTTSGCVACTKAKVASARRRLAAAREARRAGA